MSDYDFTACLSPLDFEILSADLLEAELGIQLENFSPGRDKGIDLRYAPPRGAAGSLIEASTTGIGQHPSSLIVQCKRYSSFADLKSELKNKELPKIMRLNPGRYILTTSVSLSPQQADDLMALLSPYVQTTGDIFGRERLNRILANHKEIERRHIKLWLNSAGVLDSIINARTHVVSREEVERCISAAKIYVRNPTFDEALGILRAHHVCIVSGLPGIGKTTLARMLLLYFSNRGFDVVKIESDISEARAVGYHQKPRFYYYDDFLGQTAQADKLNKNEDQKLLDFMASIRDSKDSFLVLTTREYILNQAKIHYEKLDRERFDHRTCTIDLAKYSRRIKAQILYNHLHFSDLPRPHLDSLVASRGYIKVVDHRNYNPRLIQYLTDPVWIGTTPATRYLDLILQNLDNPVEIWGHAFRNQLSDRARHLLLVLATLPVESLVPDAEQAFASFHRSQCSTYGIPSSPADFVSSLKELDGTFVSTQRLDNAVIVRFQNPSIRDFMHNLLLAGELLPEVIATLVFFEQVSWFIETLTDPDPRVPIENLARYTPEIGIALRNLFGAPSCTFTVSGDSTFRRSWPSSADPAQRLVVAALAVTRFGTRDDSAWLTERMEELTAKVADGSLWPGRFVGPIKQLVNHRVLGTVAGQNLLSTLVREALSNTDDTTDLDDFEALIYLLGLRPQAPTESEIVAAREAYVEYIDRYGDDAGIDDPDEIRNYSTRIGSVGEYFHLDTTVVQDRLRERATQIEENAQPQLEDDEKPRVGSRLDLCSDSELDSMFGTLGS